MVLGQMLVPPTYGGLQVAPDFLNESVLKVANMETYFGMSLSPRDLTGEKSANTYASDRCQIDNS